MRNIVDVNGDKIETRVMIAPQRDNFADFVIAGYVVPPSCNDDIISTITQMMLERLVGEDAASMYDFAASVDLIDLIDQDKEEGVTVTNIAVLFTSCMDEYGDIQCEINSFTNVGLVDLEIIKLQAVLHCVAEYGSSPDNVRALIVPIEGLISFSYNVDLALQLIQYAYPDLPITKSILESYIASQTKQYGNIELVEKFFAGIDKAHLN